MKIEFLEYAFIALNSSYAQIMMIILLPKKKKVPGFIEKYLCLEILQYAFLRALFVGTR